MAVMIGTQGLRGMSCSGKKELVFNTSGSALNTNEEGLAQIKLDRFELKSL